MNTYTTLNQLIDPKYRSVKWSLFDNHYYIYNKYGTFGYIEYSKDFAIVRLYDKQNILITHTVSYNDPNYQVKINDILRQATYTRNNNHELEPLEQHE